MFFGDPAADEPKALTSHDTREMNARCQGSRWPAVIVGDQSHCSRNITSLTNTHQRTRKKQLLKGLHINGEEGDQRPYKKAHHYHAASAIPVREIARKGT